MATTNTKTPSNWLILAVFVVVVVGTGMFIGSVTQPGTWYATLEKPPFNPPNWAFAPVWTVLYVLIAIAGWRIWMINKSSHVMVLWCIQMVLNWAWSPTFFVIQNLWLALAVIVALLAAILLFIVRARKLDRIAAWVFVPYAAWVAFAALLNASLAVLN